MKKLWIRIGAEIEIPDDVDVNDIDKIEDIICDKIPNKEFKISGETYAPNCECPDCINDLMEGEPEVYFDIDE